MKCRFIETYQELEQVSPLWDSFLDQCEYTGFFSTSGFTRAWWRAYDKSRSMHIVFIDDPTGIRLIAPFQAEKKNPLRWELVGTNLINYNPILMRSGDEDALRQLFAWLKKCPGWSKLVLRATGKATTAHFFHQNYSGELSGPEKLQRWMRIRSLFVEQERRQDHPYINRLTLNGMRNLLQEKSYRHGLNILKREGLPEFRTTTDPAEFKKNFERFCDLHVAEWKSRGRSSQLADPETRNFYGYLFDELAPYRTMQLAMLSLNEKPIAFSIGSRWKDRMDSWITCFDLDYARAGPGKLLRGHLIQDSISEGFSEFDLGRGLQQHKKEYAPDLRETVILSIHRSPLHAFATKLKSRIVQQKAAL